MNVSRDKYPVFEKKYGKNSRYVVKPHYHSELTLGIILNGETNVSLNSTMYNLKKGSIILIPKGSVHMCDPVDKDNFEYLVLHIDNSFIENELGLDPKYIKPQKMYYDIETLYSFKDSKINNDQLIAIFLQFNLGHIDEGNSNIVDIKNYIDNNYLDKISLDSISEVFGLNKFTLIRSFKKKYNLSPHLYLINKRINRAKELIIDNYSIADTSVYCGFYDQSHFIKTFKDYTGITPELYR